MNKKNSNEVTNENNISDRIIQELLKNPKRTDREIAKKLNTYRQKIWRHRKQLEDTNKIWGYTAITNESERNHVVYLILIKMKPMDEKLSSLIINRNIKKEPSKQKIRLINVLYVNGEYDWLIMFSAPDHKTARRYYDSLRVAYNDYLLEKPKIIDVNFTLIREGKINPDIKKLKTYVPLE
jgi:DNA-binding Lrp family transcriptional regulator